MNLKTPGVGKPCAALYYLTNYDSSLNWYSYGNQKQVFFPWGGPHARLPRTLSSVVGLAGGVLCYRVAPTECHGGHDTARIARLEKQVEMLSSRLEAVSEFTGQGDAIFSWDVELTNCFPKE